MDGLAVYEANEEHLKALGLIQIGHIVALKSFCREEKKTTQSQNLQKQLLAETIKQSSKDRTKKKPENKKLQQFKTIFLGWQHYDRKKRKYVNVRESRGGGVRTCKFLLKTSVEEVMDKMESFFFRNGQNSFVGRLSCLKACIGNSNGDILGSRESGFDLSNYITTNGFSRLRLYLLTKQKSLDEWQFSHDGSDSDDDFDLIPKQRRLIGNFLLMFDLQYHKSSYYTLIANCFSIYYVKSTNSFNINKFYNSYKLTNICIFI